MKSHPLRKQEDYANIPLEGQIFIESSAGTGKTYTLETLYVRLLAEQNLALEDILVVTFTESATKELKERLQARLASTENMGHHVSRFGEAQIFTMHGFARNIIRDFAPALGIRENFQLKTEEDLAVTYKKALYRFFRRHENDIQSDPKLEAGYHAFLRLITTKTTGKTSFKKLIETLKDLLKAERIEELGEFLSNPESREIETLWQGKGTKELTKALENWQASLLPLKVILGREKHPFSKRAKGMQYFIQSLEILSSLKFSEEFLWGNLEKLSITSPKDESSPLIRILDFSARPKDFLKTKEVLPPEINVDLINSSTQNLQDLLPILLLEPLGGTLSPLSLWLGWHFASFVLETSLRELDELKNRENLYSFDDVLRTLVNAESILDEASQKELSGRYRAILIDEFQDTDPSQWAIFSRLMSQEDTLLFMIGDAKQAIYGFRGADLSTFYLAKKEIRESETAHFFHLPVSRRSHAQLLDSFNAIFHPLFSREQALFSHSRYDSVEAHEPDAPHLSPNPLITVLAPDPENKQNELLSFLEKFNRFLGEEQIDPKDCVILSKNQKHLNELIRLNRERSLRLPIALYQEQTLSQTKEAQATFDFLKSLLFPHKYFARLMLSPFFALPLNLVSWLGQADQEILRHSLIGQVSLLLEALETSGNFLTFLKELDEFSRKIRKNLSTIFPFLSSLEKKELEELGFEERLILRDEEQSLGIFREVFSWLLAIIRKPQDMGTFFKNLEEGKIESPSSQPERGNKTLLMTMHKSKGLEFSHVFIVGRSALISTHENEALFLSFYEDETRKTDFFRQQKTTQKRLLTLWQEEKNLLYVALTRAKNRVFLFWGTSSKNTSLDQLLSLVVSPPTDQEELAGRLKTKPKREELAEKLREASFLHYEELLTFQGINVYKEQEKKTLILPASSPSLDEILNRSLETLSFSKLIKATSDQDAEIVQSALPNESPLPKGAMTGNWIHLLLENLPFSSALGTQNSAEWANQEIRLKGFSGTIQGYFLLTLRAELPSQREEELVLKTGIRMVWNLLKSPLSPIGLSLDQTDDKRTLKEHQFTLKTGLPTQKTIGREAELLEKHLKTGYLTGIIDCLIEIEGKLYILDWKTNFLGNEAESYSPDALELAMQENDYHLQYSLYTLALESWGKVYRPETPFPEFFGGVFYLFTRAFLDSPQDKYGVFWAEPDPKAIASLSHFFDNPTRKESS